jgi:hypothetical protein
MERASPAAGQIMDTRPITRRLTEFREALTEQIQVAELIVFGSYLEGPDYASPNQNLTTPIP